MMLTTIWERHVFFTLVQTFLFFLCSFFFIYTVLDYSTHMQDFTVAGNFQIISFLQYYLHQFLKRANLLLPLAAMIAAIKLMLSLNSSKELVALLTSGLKKSNIVRPFIFLGMLCTVFNWLSAELFLPKALAMIEGKQKIMIDQTTKNERPFFVCRLSAESTLIFQKSSPDMQQLWDVFWIKEHNKVWRMKKLHFISGKATGFCVDEMVINSDGFLHKERSFPKLAFNEIKFKNISTAKPKAQLENLSLSQLNKFSKAKNAVSKKEKNEASALLHYRAILPLLSIASVLCPLPYCMRYSRSFPHFLLYILALFSFITTYTFFDAALIISSSKTFPPIYLFAPPFILAFWFGCTKLFKT